VNNLIPTCNANGYGEFGNQSTPKHVCIPLFEEVVIGLESMDLKYYGILFLCNKQHKLHWM
jgi:hypothetical protein